MSGRVRLSPRALADLDEIYGHTHENWGLAQAERYIRALHAAMRSAAEDPRRGRACDDVRPGYRGIASGSHAIYYRWSGRDVVVVRILHQRMDPDRHMP